MRIRECSFCSSPVYPGHGRCFIRNDGSEFFFCRSKCSSAFHKKRNPRKVKWTKAYRRAKGKELTTDFSLELEKRRDCPIKYNRETWQKTVEGMKRITEIKTKRKAKHIMDRLKEGKKIETQKDKIEVERNIHLIKAPAAGLRQKNKEMEVEMDDEEEREQVEVMMEA